MAVDIADDAIAGASISIAALSVSISKSKPAFLTVIAFLHMPLGDLAGGHVHIDFGQYDFDRHGSNPAVHEIADLLDDSRRLRHGGFFKSWIVGNGRVDAAKSENWRIEVIEGLTFGN
jgi:hypothetical protein